MSEIIFLRGTKQETPWLGDFFFYQYDFENEFYVGYGTRPKKTEEGNVFLNRKNTNWNIYPSSNPTLILTCFHWLLLD